MEAKDRNVVHIDVAKELRRLRSEIEEREAEYKLLQTLANRYGVKVDKVQATSFNGETSQSASDEGFPVNAVKEKQILYAFEKIGKAVRLPEFNNIFKTMTSPDYNVQNKCRNMVNSGHLAGVIYNQNKKKSYYGLSSWIEGNDFKPEFAPDKDSIALGEITAELLR